MEIFEGGMHAFASTGERVRAVRKSRKMTQKEFSASLGIVQGFLCSIEKGKKSPSDTLLIALQHLYGINPAWLNDGNGEMFLAPLPAAIPQVSSAIPLYAEAPTSLESLPAAKISVVRISPIARAS